MTIHEIRKKIVPVLKAHGIKRAGIFGSAARGELRRNSDIDILIDTDGKLGLLSVVGMKLELEEQLKRNVDLVEYSALKPVLRERILDSQIQVV